MKNELGIEVCCENCEYVTYNNKGCGITESDNAYNFNKVSCVFRPSKSVYEARIKELQEQQFTREELNTIIDALQIAKEEFAFCPEEKAFEKILKKIEQTLKNLEGNLNKQQ